MLGKSLRDRIGKVILEAFERSYWESRHESSDPSEHLNYDPDVCWRAADSVVAVIVEALTGQRSTPKKNGGISVDSQRLF
jgi:hypothetical protein